MCQVSCGILVPWPGTEPMLPGVEAWSLSHGTIREVLPATSNAFLSLWYLHTPFWISKTEISLSIESSAWVLFLNPWKTKTKPKLLFLYCPPQRGLCESCCAGDSNIVPGRSKWTEVEPRRKIWGMSELMLLTDALAESSMSLRVIKGPCHQ